MSDHRSGRRLAVFGYGSLVSPESAALSLGRPVEPIRATLAGWRRGWTIERHNDRHEKSFERLDGGPLGWMLGLNIDPDPNGPAERWPNGALLAIAPDELVSLERRELRYDAHDVSEQIEIDGDRRLPPEIERAVAFKAKAPHRAPAEPRAGAVIFSSYVTAVEAAFEELGPGELEAFRRTTGPLPVEAVDVRLVRDEIPPGNPRDW